MHPKCFYCDAKIQMCRQPKSTFRFVPKASIASFSNAKYVHTLEATAHLFI